ncbi:MAG: RNA polymerase factor sigma-54 [Bdellovibrionales bacterium]
MNLVQRIDQRQIQTLVMTPQLQQAIKLLQMTNMELGAFVEEELEKNPLLERDDLDQAEDSPEKIALQRLESISRSISSDAPLNPTNHESTPEAPSEDSWASDGYTDEDRFSSVGSGGSFDDDEFSATQNIPEKPSLRAHLLEQVSVDFNNPADRLIAVSLVDALDEAGYLPADLAALRTQLGATEDHFELIIARLQRFDPCGIFARSLHECLALQLCEKDRLDPPMAILLQHLDLLAKHENALLMRLCNVNAEDLAGMVAEIRRLNPKPALAFASDLAPPIVPDVFLRPQQGGGWHIELNTETLPRVLANERYYSQIQASASKKADKEYIANHWQQANWLVKAMHQRATTILKVAGEIVRQQEAFFVGGVHHLKPLILKDIATAVEMHESTISRVTQNKYVATPRGMFELKYFFTTALARSDGGDDMSSEAVRARIRTMIESEKPTSILSDDHLSMKLRGEGIDIARRTVAKYREAMHIPTSAQRRREKR